MKNLVKNDHSVLYVIVFMLALMTVLLIASVLFVRTEQQRSFETNHVDIFELRLPPLDLGKYSELEKAKKLVLE